MWNINVYNLNQFVDIKEEADANSSDIDGRGDEKSSSSNFVLTN